jgi:hypothetical protein
LIVTGHVAEWHWVVGIVIHVYIYIVLGIELMSIIHVNAAVLWNVVILTKIY